MTAERGSDDAKLGPDRPLIKWAADALAVDPDALLSAFEGGLPVRLIATFEGLRTCESRQSVEDADRIASEGAFDHLPVTENDLIVGLYQRKATPKDADFLSHNGRLVRDVMHRLDETILISSQTGILSFMDGALEHPCRLVLEGERITGIVTLSDLQRLPVRSAIFLHITHLEILMTQMIERSGVKPEVWLTFLDDNVQKLIKRQWRKDAESGVAIDPIYAASLSHKSDIFSRIFSGWMDDEDRFQVDMPAICQLRNEVAHGKDYAGTREAAEVTLRTIANCKGRIASLRRLQQKLVSQALEA